MRVIYICRALRCVLLFRIAKLDTLFMVFLLSPLLGTLLTSSGMLPVAIFNALETRLMCLIEQAAGVLGRSSRLRMAPRDNHGWIPGVAAHTCRTALGGFGAAGQYARRGQV